MEITTLPAPYWVTQIFGIETHRTNWLTDNGMSGPISWYITHVAKNKERLESVATLVHNSKEFLALKWKAYMCRTWTNKVICICARIVLARAPSEIKLNLEQPTNDRRTPNFVGKLLKEYVYPLKLRLSLLVSYPFPIPEPSYLKE